MAKELRNLVGVSGARATVIKAPKTKDGDGNFIEVDIVNLIGKQVTVLGGGNDVLGMFPACATITVDKKVKLDGYAAGVPIFQTEHTLSEGLPKPSAAKFYLVTDDIVKAARLEGRSTDDLLTPMNAIMSTYSIDCTGLERH